MQLQIFFVIQCFKPVTNKGDDKLKLWKTSGNLITIWINVHDTRIWFFACGIKYGRTKNQNFTYNKTYIYLHVIFSSATVL